MALIGRNHRSDFKYIFSTLLLSLAIGGVAWFVLLFRHDGTGTLAGGLLIYFLGILGSALTLCLFLIRHWIAILGFLLSMAFWIKIIQLI